MASFVLVGDEIINLDAINYVGKVVGSSDRRIHFAEDQYTDIRGEEAAALDAYLRGMAIDVVDYHQAVLADQAIEATRKRVYAETVALLESCTDPTGHAWWASDDTGWDCVHCAAHCGLGALDEVITCWGGVQATSAAVS